MASSAEDSPKPVIEEAAESTMAVVVEDEMGEFAANDQDQSELPVVEKQPAETPEELAEDKRSSRRSRASTSRYVPEEIHAVKSTSTASLGAATGLGQRLGDFEGIKQNLDKHKAADEPLPTLHRILYGRNGEQHKRKAAIRDWTGVAAKEYPEAPGLKARLQKIEKKVAVDIAHILGVPVSGNKEELVARLHAFLVKPSSSLAKRASTTTKKRKSTATTKSDSSKKPRTQNSSSKSKRQPLSEEFVNSEDEEDEEHDEKELKSAEEEDVVDEEDEAPPTKVIKMDDTEESNDSVELSGTTDASAKIDDSELDKHLNHILQSGDLTILNKKRIRELLEERTKLDLTGKKQWISDKVDEFMDSLPSENVSSEWRVE